MSPRVAATDEWTCVSTSISILRASEVDTCFSMCRLIVGQPTVSQSVRPGSSGFIISIHIRCFEAATHRHGSIRAITVIPPNAITRAALREGLRRLTRAW